MDHLVLFILHLQIKRVDNSPSELNNNVLLLEFCSHNSQYCGGFYCNRFGCHEQNSTLEAIIGCCARVMRISETDDAEIYEEIIRSKKKLYHKLKWKLKKLSLFVRFTWFVMMQMRVSTFQEHSNSLYIQTAVNSEPMAPKLELSLGLAGASPCDPCPGRESLHSEPMIIEQQNTGTSDDEDPSFSAQLLNFFTLMKYFFPL